MLKGVRDTDAPYRPRLYTLCVDEDTIRELMDGGLDVLNVHAHTLDFVGHLRVGDHVIFVGEDDEYISSLIFTVLSITPSEGDADCVDIVYGHDKRLIEMEY